MIHVLVADSRTIRVFEAGPQGDRLDELVAFRNPLAGRHERDLEADRPGRVIGGTSGVHHSYEPSVGAREHARRRWLRSLGPSLQAFLAARGNTGLVLVAAPRTLAQLHVNLPASVRNRIKAELSRDLGGQPHDVLIKRLQPTLREAVRKSAQRNPVYRGAGRTRLPISAS
jgi:protein required for attachment to host cells